MWTTVAKWVGLIGVALVVLYLPFKYIDEVRTESYAAGYSAGQVECDKARVLEAQETLRKAEEVASRESQATAKLATELAKQRKQASDLKGKLDEALKTQPEVVGCVLNDDATDLMRYAAEGDFGAVEQQRESISGPPVDEMSRGATVPGGQRNANLAGPSGNVR